MPLIVSTLKSVIASGSGRAAPIGTFISWSISAKSRTLRGSAARGWTTIMPIMPSAICVISSTCGWYMNVPARSNVNSYLNVLPGAIAVWVSAGDAVHAVRHEDAVPVDRRRLGQRVRDVDADAIALDRLDHRAGRRAVVAPRLDLQAGRDLVLERRGAEVEDLRAAGVHA